MTINFRRPLAITLILAAAVSPAGIALVRADSPGGLFLDLDEGGAAVVRPPSAQAKARIATPPAIPSEDIATAIKEGAQPVGTAVILAYHGELYIMPDKQIGKRMASEMVMNPAPRSRN
jgi:hypothetical protein